MSTGTAQLVIEQRFIEDLLLDPVMACAVVMGEKRLDAFQRAMLRMMWYCPVSMDSSGQGSGKTWLMFHYLNLRTVMLPDHHTIYIPQSLDQGERMFWNKYYEGFYLKPGVAPIFCEQLKQVRGSKFGTVNREGYKMRKFRSGGQILMIPPNISKEGASAAGEDCNTIGIEEWGRLCDTEKGLAALDGQFISRWRRPSVNPASVIFGDHCHLSGHAEEPSHPTATRFEQYARAIADGSHEHAQFTFCHRDFSPATRKRVVNETAWEDEKNAAPVLYKRKYLGLRASGLDTFYPEALLNRVQRTDLVPECARSKEFGGDCEYFGGQDYAPGFGARADYSAHVVKRLRPVSNEYMQRVKQAGQPMVGFVRAGAAIYEIATVFAARFKALSPTELAAMIHFLNLRWGYTSITSDPQGGGTLVYSEINKPEAVISGVRQVVIPICTKAHAAPDRLPIWQWFELRDPNTGRPGIFCDLPHIGPRWTQNPAGIIAACHNQIRLRLVRGEEAMPAPIDHYTRTRASVADWTGEMIEAAKGLRILRTELMGIGQRRKNGQPLVTTIGGYPMFGSRGKKDVAMAYLYASAGVEKRLAELSSGTAQEEDDED